MYKKISGLCTLIDSGYSVRSVYKLTVALRNDIQSSSSGGLEFFFWKKLWRILVAPKVCNFWWRVIKGFVPSRAVLCARHIEQISFCEACGQEETIIHALFECTWAKLFWHEIKLVTSVKLPVFHPHTWVMGLVEGITVKSGATCVILCGVWAVWAERNTRTHGETSRSIMQSVKWATDITTDLAITEDNRRRSLLGRFRNGSHQKNPSKKSTWMLRSFKTHQGGIGLGVRPAHLARIGLWRLMLLGMEYN